MIICHFCVFDDLVERFMYCRIFITSLYLKVGSFFTLTIFSIVLLSFASFLILPAYAVNENLYVSAENSLFENYMSGPQVIEVVVLDSAIWDTDEAEPEPEVNVNGRELRMVQGVDGNWYGYFADATQAFIADATTETAPQGVGLNFGAFCSPDSAIFSDDGTILFSDTVGVAVPMNPVGSVNGTAAQTVIPLCTALTSSVIGTNAENVVREAEDVNAFLSDDIGQIDLVNTDIWPFIQLYDLNPTGNVQVLYDKGGGPQVVILTFDSVDNLAATGVEIDRALYPRGAHVHVTVSDTWLNIDPTDIDSWTFGTNETNGATTNYQVFDESGALAGAGITGGVIDISGVLSNMMVEDNGVLLVNVNAQSVTNDVLTLQDNNDSVITCTDSQDASTCTIGGVAAGLGVNSQPVTITETEPSSGIFTTFDEFDTSILMITDNALQGTSGFVDYNDNPAFVLTDFSYGSVDIQPIDAEWNSGEEIPIEVIDSDMNQNSLVDEDLEFYNPESEIIPALKTGNPFTLESLTTAELSNIALSIQEVQPFSQRAMLDSSSNSIPILDGDSLVLVTGDTFADLYTSINNPSNDFNGFNFFHYDIRSLQNSATIGSIVSFDVDVTDGTNTSRLASNVNSFNDNLIDLSSATGDDIFSMDILSPVQMIFTFDTITTPTIPANTVLPIAVDFFSFGFTDDGVQASERISNQIIRIEAEESGDNTGIFEGSLEYVMINQLNILDVTTFAGITPISDEVTFIVIEDLTDEDAPQVTYADIDAEGLLTQVSDREEAPSHSGVVSFNADSYKTADNVVVTLDDVDLNVNSDLIDMYTVVDLPESTDVDNDQVGFDVPATLESFSFGSQGRLLDITYDSVRWTDAGPCSPDSDDGLGATGFTLKETGASTGVFEGTFEIPPNWCRTGTGSPEITAGLDIQVNYVDYRDASGEIIEVGDSTIIRANTGSVSLDRTVYPVPFGSVDNFFPGLSESDNVTPDGDSIFPVHQTAVIADGDQNIDVTAEEITPGDLLIYITINDPDFDIQQFGIDEIALGEHGPVEIMLTRGSDTLLLATAGGVAANTGVITSGIDIIPSVTREIGPITEVAPDAGIFELTFPIRYTDGPDSAGCPTTPDEGYTSLNGNTGPLGRFNELPQNGSYCVLSGDVISVQYNDPVDASSNPNTVTDSATTDLRDGSIQTHNTVYVIGADIIFTLIEADFDLDSDNAETYDLDLIEWDSETATLTVGDLGGEIAAFDPEPMYLRETGDSTGIFQLVFAIPATLDGNQLQDGEAITLTITDWSPNSASYVGEQSIDQSTTIFTANSLGSIFCDDMTIDELIASGNYNVIDNRDNSLGTEFSGTNTDDLILASDVGDIINAKDGNDCVIGGVGHDDIHGGAGDDVIFGETGYDILRGGAGDDVISGGMGVDLIVGGGGNDVLSGNDYPDVIHGRSGDDLISGGDGDDVLFGGVGSDTLSCGEGIDVVLGGHGTDTATADCEKIKNVP